MNNVTFLVEPSDFFHNKGAFKAILQLVTILGQAISLTICPGIIYYECQSGDPMKRTILNQIMTLLSYNIVLGNLVVGTVMQIRLLFGVLNYNFVIYIFEVPKVAVSLTAIFLGGECITIRYLCICIWKRAPPPINSDFFYAFFALINLLLATFLAAVQSFGRIVSDELIFMMTGVHQDENVPSFKIFNFAVFCLIGFICLTEFQVRRQKKKTRILEVGRNNYNNRGSNKLLSSSKFIKINFITISVMAVMFIYIDFGEDSAQFHTIIFKFLLPLVDISIVGPLLVIYENPDILTFCWKSLRGQQ